MNKRQRRQEVRNALQGLGYWPTEAGAKAMQDEGEQMACKADVMQNLDRLDPEDLLAVTALIGTLAWASE